MHGRRGFLIGAALAVFFFGAPAPARAFIFTDGTTAICRGSNGEAVLEEYSARPQIFAGFVKPRREGGWTISWDEGKLGALPSAVHDFVFFHECAHAEIPSEDELRANCRALIDMRRAGRSSPKVEEELARFHFGRGWMGGRYGRGEDYWRRTVACADADQSSGRTVE